MNRKFTVLVLLTMLLAACVTTKPESATPASSMLKTPFPTQTSILLIGDGGVITGQPCEAPCFLGVKVGETLLKQVVPLLESHGISSCAQDTEMRVICGDIILIGVNPSTTVVDGIGFESNKSILVEYVIAKYGQPDFVHVIPSGMPESPATTVLLFFDSIKMRIHLSEVDGVNYTVSSKSEIGWITYFDNIVYSDFENNMFAQPWTGYGIYKP